MSQDHDLVILTQNIWGGAALWERRRTMLARLISDLRPGLIGLQEVHAPGASGELGQAGELARLAGGYRAWFAPGRVAAGGECEGVALLCREDIEVLDHSLEALTLDREDPFERDSQRVVLRAAIRHAGAVIDVLVTHLSLSKRARARTVRELVRFAAREREKSGSLGAVLMGDFNALPSEEAVCYLQASAGDGCWLDAWTQAHPGKAGGTWPAGLPLRRIDYVFVQPGEGWTITRCERAPFSGSDHHGVVAWLRLGA
ncbi:endonuclease/exonuclease/phosphatase family protein [Sorangium sp. So ce1014]|uniref:endonuclease/exonuclease/phosphatase family protein n=1 Tax=Sorangium sp. So ce1014 TaxID=3133326 RepID=UPI003F6091D5